MCKWTSSRLSGGRYTSRVPLGAWRRSVPLAGSRGDHLAEASADAQMPNRHLVDTPASSNCAAAMRLPPLSLEAVSARSSAP